MPLEAWLALAGANLLLLLAPGPTMLLIVGTTLRHGSQSAFLTVLGVAFGIATALTAVLGGIGGLLATAPWGFRVLQVVGAVYLCALGINALRCGTTASGERDLPPTPALGFLARGLVIEIANPKPLVFYAAFVPQFVDPARPLVGQFVLIAGTIVVQGFLFDMLCVALAGRGRRLLEAPERLSVVDRVVGMCLIGAGGGTLLVAY